MDFWLPLNRESVDRVTALETMSKGCAFDDTSTGTEEYTGSLNERSIQVQTI